MAKKEEIKPAVEEQSALVATEAQLPAFMRGKAGAGMEQIRPEDVEVPRLKLLQALSPELKIAEHLKAGHWFHSVAEIGMGRSVRVVPLYADQSYILWRPRKSGGGILARAMDGIHWSPPDSVFNVKLDSGKEVTWKTASTVAKSGLAEWGSTDPTDPNSHPAATRMYNLVVLPLDHLELGPAVVTMQRASIRVARKLFSRLKLVTATAPLYGLLFDLAAEETKNAAGQEFIVPKWTQAGFLQDEKVFSFCERLSNIYKEMGLKIRDIEGLQPEAEETPAEAPPGGAGDGNKF
jgi:hypothetical protein